MATQDMTITDKVILITGASTGIGAATARLLAPDNTIFIHYYSSEEAAQEVARDVEAAGGTAHLIQADLRTEAGCRQIHQAVAEQAGHLDVLVNNAGAMLHRHSVRELSWDFITHVLNLNTVSVIFLSSLLIPLLEEGTQPCVINVTSIAMRSGAPSATVYAAAKGAIDTFTRGLAKELAPNVRVNALAPGVIATPFHEKVSTPEQMKRFRESTPLKELGTAEQIAMAVPLLIANPFMTGATIDINGGMFMY